MNPMPDTSLPPSRFGAGYTVRAAPLPQQAGNPMGAVSSTAAPLLGPAGAAVVNAPPAASTVKVDSWAAVSFILVLLFGPFVAPATLPMGLVARKRISGGTGGGRAFATAAVALSCVYLAAAAVLLVLAFVT
jgi:hypothetical protein